MVGRCEEDEGAREGTGVVSIVSVHEGHDLALDALVPELLSRSKVRRGKSAQKN